MPTPIHLKQIIKNLLNKRTDLTITPITSIHNTEATGYHIRNKDTEAHRATIIMVNAITYIPQDQTTPRWQEWHIADPNLLPQLTQLIKELPSHPTLNPHIHIDQEE